MDCVKKGLFKHIDKCKFLRLEMDCVEKYNDKYKIMLDCFIII